MQETASRYTCDEKWRGGYLEGNFRALFLGNVTIYSGYNQKTTGTTEHSWN